MEELEFNINNKRGCASKKILEEIKSNKKNYSTIKENLISEANERLGLDVIEDYSLPNDFNLETLDYSIFRRRCLQKYFLPFSNEQIDKFMTLAKQAINTPYFDKVRGKLIYGSYLVSNDNGKCLVFALSIVRGSQDNENMTDFSIKIDMLVSGKEWFQIARFDSIGAGHPNYIVDGKIAKSLKYVEFAQTPHIHTNTEETQVLFSTQSGCEYTPAKCIEELRLLRNNSNKDYYKRCVDLFLEFANIKTKINDRVKGDYRYSRTKPLFDETDTLKVDYVSKFLGGEAISKELGE